MRTAKSQEAISALELAEELQSYFVQKLNDLSHTFGKDLSCESVEWLRDEGVHGGGVRYETRDETVFNRGSVNVSQVHYDEEDKKLSSATAISTIIHPQNPHAPSMHMHISWTQMREGKGYWRIMADLNPSMKDAVSQRTFDRMLDSVSGEYYDQGIEQGESYFYIPALKRTRGVSHFYLEGFNTGDFEADRAFAKKVGMNVIDAYIGIVLQALQYYINYTAEEKAAQIDYHTLYLFQVLTLDKGTTSGLLVHDQNDIGIMGSLPSHINKDLLLSWRSLMNEPQDKLLDALMEVLPNEIPTPISIETKKMLADAVRDHYKRYPEAISMQASQPTVTTTVANHT